MTPKRKKALPNFRQGFPEENAKYGDGYRVLSENSGLVLQTQTERYHSGAQQQ